MNCNFIGQIGRNFGPQYLLKLYLGGAIAGSIFYLAYHAFMADSFQVIDILFIKFKQGSRTCNL